MRALTSEESPILRAEHSSLQRTHYLTRSFVFGINPLLSKGAAATLRAQKRGNTHTHTHNWSNLDPQILSKGKSLKGSRFSAERRTEVKITEPKHTNVQISAVIIQ